MTIIDTMSIASGRSGRNQGHSISQALRDLRKAAGLTLIELANRSSLAASTVSKVENGQMSPTYDTLLALADGLDIDIGDLVTGGRNQVGRGRRAITRHDEGPVTINAHFDIRHLCHDIAVRAFVPYHVNVKSQSVHEFAGLLTHGGEEFIYVLEGNIELHTEFYAPARLGKGDCSYFDSTMGHAITNPTDKPARILWICSREVAPIAPC